MRSGPHPPICLNIRMHKLTSNPLKIVVEFCLQLARMYEALSPLSPQRSMTSYPRSRFQDFAQALDEDISAEEVALAIKFFEVSKRKGPDGFSAKFYKLLSPALTPRLVAMYNEVKKCPLLCYRFSLAAYCNGT